MPVVAAVDQSSRAPAVVEKGRELAEKYDVDLHVVYVGQRTIGNSEEAAREEAAETAREIANEVIEAPFVPVGLFGDPAPELIEYSNDKAAEYIVVSSRKRSRLDHAIFGGVTQTLLTAADRPIVAIP